MSIFKKFFCCHKWATHAKKETEHLDEDVVQDYGPLLGMVTKKTTYTSITEIMICERCGDIKTLNY